MLLVVFSQQHVFTQSSRRHEKNGSEHTAWRGQEGARLTSRGDLTVAIVVRAENNPDIGPLTLWGKEWYHVGTEISSVDRGRRVETRLIHSDLTDIAWSGVTGSGGGPSSGFQGVK